MSELGDALLEDFRPWAEKELLRIERERRLLASFLGRRRARKEVERVGEKYYNAAIEDLLKKESEK